MNLVTLEGVAKQYSERLLFEGVDLRVNRGDRVGLIGVNGSGKTTLLRLLVGDEEPDEGRRTVWGGVRIQFLSQDPVLDDRLTVLDQLLQSDHPDLSLLRDYRAAAVALEAAPGDAALSERVSALASRMEGTDAWSAEARAKAVLSRLGVHDFEARLGTLSGGQRKRVALARALIDPADVLVLDEPTNHIDADAVSWLEDYLLDVPAALVMVTHDRYFLDRVVNRIVELDRRTLVAYPGNYTRYLEQRSLRHERLKVSEDQRQRQLRRELEWLRKAPKARTTKQKARRDRVAELEQLSYDSGEERITIALAGRRLGKKVMQCRGLAKAYDDTPLFEGLDFDLGPGERIGVIGPNGSGKTTFLDVLAGRVAPDAGTVTWGDSVRLGYFDQAGIDLDDSQRVIAYIEDEAPLIQTDEGERVSAARMLEWFLFEGPQQWSTIGSLSGGERRRLYLLRTLLHQPNVVFLDEPTNDLDITTLGVLEAYLDRFKGCLVVVSHDRYFLDRTVDQLVYFESGRFGLRYPTPYSVYQRLRAEEEARATRQTPVAPTPEGTPAARGGSGGGEAAAAPGPRRLTWKERREIEALEALIEGLDARVAALSAEINQCGSDYVRLERATADLASAEAELEEAMARWVALSEIDEAAQSR